MKINKTTLGVILFVTILLLAGYSAKSNAEPEIEPRVSVGKTFINSDVKVGEFGLEYNDYELSYTLLGEGSTKNGYQDETVGIVSASYLTKPDWGYKGIDPYFRLGVSYVENGNSQLVGPDNFRLGVGLDFHDVWRVEYSHFSSSGIYKPNAGIDYITITYKMPSIFK